jgi:hypothetical protein
MKGFTKLFYIFGLCFAFCLIPFIVLAIVTNYYIIAFQLTGYTAVIFYGLHTIKESYKK